MNSPRDAESVRLAHPAREGRATTSRSAFWPITQRPQRCSQRSQAENSAIPGGLLDVLTEVFSVPSVFKALKSQDRAHSKELMGDGVWKNHAGNQSRGATPSAANPTKRHKLCMPVLRSAMA